MQFLAKYTTTPERERLLCELFTAHMTVAMRGNAAAICFDLSSQASGSLVNGVISALASFGVHHGPVCETYDILTSADKEGDVARIVGSGGKVPGWGNSFAKGKPDEAFLPVEELLRTEFPEVWSNVETIQKLINKPILPNPSCYTAASAMALGMPRDVCPVLLILPRIFAWSDYYCSTKE